MVYRCVAASVAGFVQQLAVAYVANGYWFYVTGRVPDGRQPAASPASRSAAARNVSSRLGKAKRIIRRPSCGSG